MLPPKSPVPFLRYLLLAVLKNTFTTSIIVQWQKTIIKKSTSPLLWPSSYTPHLRLWDVLALETRSLVIRHIFISINNTHKMVSSYQIRSSICKDRGPRGQQGRCVRRLKVTATQMSDNGWPTTRKTTIHKLVDYFGAITVPGMNHNSCNAWSLQWMGAWTRVNLSTSPIGCRNF